MVSFVISIALSQKRHITFYRDDTRQEALLEIVQEHKFHLVYTVREMGGDPLARLEKNYLYDLFRKRWLGYDPTGQQVWLVQEDQWLLAILRRVIAPLFGLLRTNFVIMTAQGERLLGKFDRQFTLLNRYVLDLTADPERSLDRRIALAIGCC